MMPLTLCSKGETCVIQRIGGNDKMRHCLFKLGLVQGSNVKIVSKFGNNLIVSIKDSRIAISSEMANKIMVNGGRV